MGSGPSSCPPCETTCNNPGDACDPQAPTSLEACGPVALRCGEHTYYDGVKCQPDGHAFCPGHFVRETGTCQSRAK